MVDLLVEGLVIAPSRLCKAVAGKLHPSKRKKRALEVIAAMSRIGDHMLRDIGLYRAQLGVVSQLSDKEIRSWCRAREVANEAGGIPHCRPSSVSASDVSRWIVRRRTRE